MKKYLILLVPFVMLVSCSKKEEAPSLPTTTLIINPETQNSLKLEERKAEVKTEEAKPEESAESKGHWDKAGHEIKEGFKETGHDIKKGSEKAGHEMKKGFEKAGSSIKNAFD